ncbi:MAG: Phosphoribosylformimino-5-aminoimidazole carboxamide ribotide isomerase, partial [uncultured Thermomicrobiales bacterium]
DRHPGDRPARRALRPALAGRLRPRDSLWRRSGADGPPLAGGWGGDAPCRRSRWCAGWRADPGGDRRRDGSGADDPGATRRGLALPRPYCRGVRRRGGARGPRHRRDRGSRTPARGDRALGWRSNHPGARRARGAGRHARLGRDDRDPRDRSGPRTGRARPAPRRLHRHRARRHAARAELRGAGRTRRRVRSRGDRLGRGRAARAPARPRRPPRRRGRDRRARPLHGGCGVGTGRMGVRSTGEVRSTKYEVRRGGPL